MPVNFKKQHKTSLTTMSGYNHNKKDPWDCSNQGKRYTDEDLETIYNMSDNGFSDAAIARQFKRGEWAIHVVLMIRKNKENDQQRRILHGTKHTNPQQRSIKFNQMMNKKARQNQIHQVVKNTQRGRSIKQIKKENNQQKQDIVKTSSNEMEDHLKAMMGM